MKYCLSLTFVCFFKFLSTCQELIITPNVAAPFAGQRNLSRKECIAVEANNQAQGDWRFK